jgi:hypothetical protein
MQLDDGGGVVGEQADGSDGQVGRRREGTGERGPLGVKSDVTGHAGEADAGVRRVEQLVGGKVVAVVSVERHRREIHDGDRLVRPSVDRVGRVRRPSPSGRASM